MSNYRTVTPAYARGESGEFLLDLIESHIDGQLSTEEMIRKMLELGLNEDDVGEILWEEGLVS